MCAFSRERTQRRIYIQHGSLLLSPRPEAGELSSCYCVMGARTESLSARRAVRPAPPAVNSYKWRGPATDYSQSNCYLYAPSRRRRRISTRRPGKTLWRIICHERPGWDAARRPNDRPNPPGASHGSLASATTTSIGLENKKEKNDRVVRYAF